jgi:hypothetical protein
MAGNEAWRLSISDGGAETNRAPAVPAQAPGEQAGSGEQAEGGQQPSDSSPELPDDFYVTLQPLTLALVATQLDRIGVRYERHAEAIVADLERASLLIKVLSGEMLTLQATLRKGYPAVCVTALVGRCNWWNTQQASLKASTLTAVARPPADQPASASPVAAVGVRLDLDMPFPAGIAPVQLQALLRFAVSGVDHFWSRARLDTLASPELWR